MNRNENSWLRKSFSRPSFIRGKENYHASPILGDENTATMTSFFIRRNRKSVAPPMKLNPAAFAKQDSHIPALSRQSKIARVTYVPPAANHSKVPLKSRENAPSEKNHRTAIPCSSHIPTEVILAKMEELKRKENGDKKDMFKMPILPKQKLEPVENRPFKSSLKKVRRSLSDSELKTKESVKPKAAKCVNFSLKTKEFKNLSLSNNDINNSLFYQPTPILEVTVKNPKPPVRSQSEVIVKPREIPRRTTTFVEPQTSAASKYATIQEENQEDEECRHRFSFKGLQKVLDSNTDPGVSHIATSPFDLGIANMATSPIDLGLVDAATSPVNLELVNASTSPMACFSAHPVFIDNTNSPLFSNMASDLCSNTASIEDREIIYNSIQKLQILMEQKDKIEEEIKKIDNEMKNVLSELSTKMTKPAIIVSPEIKDMDDTFEKMEKSFGIKKPSKKNKKINKTDDRSLVHGDESFKTNTNESIYTNESLQESLNLGIPSVSSACSMPYALRHTPSRQKNMSRRVQNQIKQIKDADFNDE